MFSEPRPRRCRMMLISIVAFMTLLGATHMLLYVVTSPPEGRYSWSAFKDFGLDYLDRDKAVERQQFREQADGLLHEYMREVLGTDAGRLSTINGRRLDELSYADCIGGRGKDCWTMLAPDPDFHVRKAGFVELKNESYNLPPPTVGHVVDHVFRAFYPEGTYAPSKSQYRGGFGFYAHPLEISDAKRVLFAYQVYFPDDWDPNMGGKLPGLTGGDTFAHSVHCSGGADASERHCFSSRFMWRKENMGESYLYVPRQQAENYCNTAPKTVCNPEYGDSLGRSSFNFTKGWNTVAMDATLNTPGELNGIINVYHNGVKKLSYDRLNWRDSADITFHLIIIETFFGGGSSIWATPKDQYVDFTNFLLVKLIDLEAGSSED